MWRLSHHDNFDSLVKALSMDVLSGYANLNLKLLLYSEQRMISLKQFFLEISKNKGRNTGKNNCGGGFKNNWKICDFFLIVAY